MENSIGRLRLLLAAVIFVALLPLGVADAKDWKPGDRGACPGISPKDGSCKRPYLCEPTNCYGCVRYSGDLKCVQVCAAFNAPECKVARDTGKPIKMPRASHENAPSQPSDETVTGRYKPVGSLGVHHTQ